MKLSNLLYLVKQGFLNVWINRMMSFASVSVLMACLLTTGVAFIVMVTVGNFVKFTEHQNEIVLFLKDDLDRNQILEIGKVLKKINNIAWFKFVSKDESLKEQMKILDEDSLLLDELKKDNPLPNIYVVSLKDLSKIEGDLIQLKAIGGIYKINAPLKIANTFIKLKEILTISATAIGCILLIISIVIITNTIKLTIFNRKKEINIMKFVGATDFFIQLPFVVEGILLGIISAAASFGIIYFGYNHVLNFINRSDFCILHSMLGNALFCKNFYIYILFGYFSLGIGVGFFSSIFFVKRYLKV